MAFPKKHSGWRKLENTSTEPGKADYLRGLDMKGIFRKTLTSKTKK